MKEAYDKHTKIWMTTKWNIRKLTFTKVLNTVILKIYICRLCSFLTKSKTAGFGKTMGISRQINPRDYLGDEEIWKMYRLPFPVPFCILFVDTSQDARDQPSEAKLFYCQYKKINSRIFKLIFSAFTSFPWMSS